MNRRQLVQNRALARVAGGSVGALFTNRTEIWTKAQAFDASMKSFEGEVNAEPPFQSVPGKYHHAYEEYPEAKRKPFEAFMATWGALEDDWWGDVNPDTGKPIEGHVGYYYLLKVSCNQTFGIGCGGDDYTRVEAFQARLDQQIAAFKALGFKSSTVLPPKGAEAPPGGLEGIFGTAKTLLIIAGIGVIAWIGLGLVFPAFIGAAAATKGAKRDYSEA